MLRSFLRYCIRQTDISVHQASLRRCFRQRGSNHQCRHLSTGIAQYQRPQDTIMNVFDRQTKLKQRERAALAEDAHLYDYLKDEVASRLVDRLYDIKREFKVGVDLGCGHGLLSNHLSSDLIETLYQCELSPKLLEQAKAPEGIKVHKVIADEEFLPFKEKSVDLFISNLSLQWVNDLPGAFKQIHRALRNDGVFLATTFGTDTLFELRCSLQLAETEREGGFAPHVSPLTEPSDIGSLLQRAGFTMLTVDTDDIVVGYPTMYELMTDLKGMAENSCTWSRKAHLHRDTMLAAASIYKANYGNEDGTIPATFRIIYLIGWKPDPTQPKPAPRGSGTISIQDLGKIDQLLKDESKKKKK